MLNIKATTKTQIDKLSRFFGTDMMYVMKSGFWMNSNFIVVALFGLGSSILLAQLVSKSAYGTYQFVLALASTISVFTPNNMSSAVVRAVARGNEGDLVQATRYQLRWGIIASGIAVAVSIWYAIHNNLGLSFSLLAVALFMPSTLALNTWSAYVQGKKDYKRYFFYNVLATFIAYGGVIAVIFFRKDFFWLAFGNIIFGFLSNFIVYFLTIRQMKPGKQVSSDTLSYGKHLSIMGIPQGLVGQLDALLIFHFLGAVPLAIYSFATLLPEKLMGGLKFISIITFPKFSEKSEEDVRGFFKKKIWWLLLFLGMISLIYALISPYLFEWLFPNYTSSIPYSRVYSLCFFGIAASIAQTALISQKKTKELYFSTIASPLVKAALLIILMYYYGVWGVIWAQIIAIIFQIIFPIYLLTRKSSVKVKTPI